MQLYCEVAGLGLGRNMKYIVKDVLCSSSRRALPLYLYKNHQSGKMIMLFYSSCTQLQLWQLCFCGICDRCS